jgi:hypothetical protein
MPSIATTKPTGSIPEAGEVRFEIRHKSGVKWQPASKKKAKGAPSALGEHYDQGITTMKSVSFPVSRLRP